MRPLLAFSLSVLVPSLASAAVEAPFASQLQGIRRLALERKAAELFPAHEADQLSRWLGWYGAMERGPKLTTAEVRAELGARLRSGRYGALLLGESHSEQPEIDAAHEFMTEAFAAGPVGAFVREEYTWSDDAFLTSRGVPLLTYKNQFKPDADVEKADKLAREKLLVSYSGASHSSDRMKDYSLWTLEEYKTWGYKPGQTDMRTIERSVSDKGRKPVIVSMITEEYPWRRIQMLFLRRLVEAKPALPDLRAALSSVVDAWRAQVETLPETPGPISFVKDPTHDALWLGITPADRRPLALLACAKVLALPEAAAFAGATPVRLLESLWSRSSDERGALTEAYTVVVHLADGRDFERKLDAKEL